VGRASARAALGSAVVSTASCQAVTALPAGRRRSQAGRVPTASHSLHAESEIRFPETRKKPDLRNPKRFRATTEMVRQRCRSRLALRPSGFGFLSALGFRFSEFAYRWGERPREPHLGAPSSRRRVAWPSPPQRGRSEMGGPKLLSPVTRTSRVQRLSSTAVYPAARRATSLKKRRLLAAACGIHC